jgi:hypothetical protein
MRRVVTWAFTDEERALATEANSIAFRVGLFALTSNGTWKDLLAGAAVPEERLNLLARELRQLGAELKAKVEGAPVEVANLYRAEMDVVYALALCIDPMTETRKGEAE